MEVNAQPLEADVEHPPFSCHVRCGSTRTRKFLSGARRQQSASENTEGHQSSGSLARRGTNWRVVG